jgi:hypothetical protein
MSTAEITLDQVMALAQQLRPADQARLVAELAQGMERLLESAETCPIPAPRTPLRGLLADLGPAPSAEEIDDVQREMWIPLAADPR